MPRWVVFALVVGMLLLAVLGVQTQPESQAQSALQPGVWNRPNPGKAALSDETNNPGQENDYDADGLWGPTVLHYPQTGGSTLGAFHYLMLYTGKFRGSITINYAQSFDGANGDDSGKHWLKWDTGNARNPVFDYGFRGGYFDSRSVSNPSLLDLTDIDPCACLRMLYEGFDGSRYSIGAADSQDLIAWNPEKTSLYRSEDPVISRNSSQPWRNSGVGSPMFMMDGTKYKAWFTAFEDRDGDLFSSIGYAESTDRGKSWNVSGQPVLTRSAGYFDESFIGEPTVIRDSMFRMWYTGEDRFGNRRILYATSPDGIVWTKYTFSAAVYALPGGIADANGVNHPTVVNVNGDYKMWFAATDPNGSSRIFYAVNPRPTLDTPMPGAMFVTGKGTPQTQVVISVVETGAILGNGQVDNQGSFGVNLFQAVPSGVTVKAVVDGRDSTGSTSSATSTPGGTTPTITPTPYGNRLAFNVNIKLSPTPTYFSPFTGARGATVTPSPTRTATAGARTGR